MGFVLVALLDAAGEQMIIVRSSPSKGTCEGARRHLVAARNSLNIGPRRRPHALAVVGNNPSKSNCRGGRASCFFPMLSAKNLPACGHALATRGIRLGIVDELNTARRAQSQFKQAGQFGGSMRIELVTGGRNSQMARRQLESPLSGCSSAIFAVPSFGRVSALAFGIRR